MLFRDGRHFRMRNFGIADALVLAGAILLFALFLFCLHNAKHPELCVHQIGLAGESLVKTTGSVPEHLVHQA